MEAELTLGLPAAGALAAAALRRNRLLAYTAGVVLGLAGLASLLVTFPDALHQSLFSGSLPGPSRALLVASALSLGMTVALAGPQADRLAMLVTGLAGLAGLGAAAMAPDAITLALVIIALGGGQAAMPGRRALAVRLQGPALAALLIGIGYALAHFSHSAELARPAGLALALGLVAAIGLLPFVHQLDLAEPAFASPFAWLGFLGPVIGVAFTTKVAAGLDPAGGAVYGAVVIGLGLVNLVWGSLGAWWTAEDVGAWRYSFMADWGLVLVGLGLLVPDAHQSAFLLLLSLLLVRLPLYLRARPVVLGRARPASDPLNVVLIALLAGVAPFGGFAARLLLLKAATQLAWPLAVVLALAMLLFAGHSVRLARTVGRPTGRAAVGVWAAVATSLIISVLPGPILTAAGL